MVVDGVDLGIVRTQELAAELKIVGGVGEDQVDALVRQARQSLETVALDDPIRLECHFECHDAPLRSHLGVGEHS